MNKISNLTFILLLFLFTDAVSQAGSAERKKTQPITIERLQNAKTVEELIDFFPAYNEIVSCRISIAGKDIKYSEHILDNHILPDLFSNVHPGHKIYVEYILIKKKGFDNKVAAFDPIELEVIKNPTR